MLKKTITYTDYEGVERTEDFFFNLEQSELLEMEYGQVGGMKKLLDKVVSAQDGKKIVEIFKDLVLRAYGEKSMDGRRFIKSPELAKEFSQTPAYSAIFMELATDDQAASEFVNGIIPQNVASKVKEQMNNPSLPA